MGKQWKQWQTLFSWAPKSLQMVPAVMKLKDACSLEEKLWQTWREVKWSKSHSVVSDFLQLHGLHSPWNSPGQNTGVGTLSFSRGSSQPRDRPRSWALQADSLLVEPQGRPKNTKVRGLPRLQQIFPTQESKVFCTTGRFFTNWAMREALTNPDSILKSRHISLPTKVHLVKAMVFSSSHIWMWELDYKESWVLKSWCCWTVMMEKTLESPLDCKEIKPVNSKENQSWIFIGRTDAEAEAPRFWPPDLKNRLFWRTDFSKRPWC